MQRREECLYRREERVSECQERDQDAERTADEPPFDDEPDEPPEEEEAVVPLPISTGT